MEPLSQAPETPVPASVKRFGDGMSDAREQKSSRTTLPGRPPPPPYPPLVAQLAPAHSLVRVACPPSSRHEGVTGLAVLEACLTAHRSSC